jgi:hypothetical protein
VRIHNAQTNKENQNKKTMYQVHIKIGLDSDMIECESLQQANATVHDIANSLKHKVYYDSDGWAYAYSGKYHVMNISTFIFQII